MISATSHYECDEIRVNLNAVYVCYIDYLIKFISDNLNIKISKQLNNSIFI